MWRSTCPPVKSAAMAASAGDGRQDVVGAAGGESAAALVEQQRGAVGAGPGGPFVVDPDLQVLVPAGVDGDLVECAVLAVPDGDVALASGSVKLLTGSVDCVAEAAYISQEYLRGSHMPSSTR